MGRNMGKEFACSPKEIAKGHRYISREAALFISEVILSTPRLEEDHQFRKTRKTRSPRSTP